MEVLHTLHMDLCGPMRVQSINGKKYILVIVDDYSRFTWVKFLRSNDETPEFDINFLKQIQVGLNKTVRYIRTDNGTEFINQIMSMNTMKVLEYFIKSLFQELLNKTALSKDEILMHDNKPDLSFLRVFGALCYPTNNSEDLGILEANYVRFDELHQSMAPVHINLELLFQPMFDEYFEVTRVDAPVPSATAVNAHVVPPGTSVTTTFAQDA
ncbi:retrovirus-related pol polyprotein from transposon TNT 1-94 [Tanacetum coccineum]